MPFTDCRTLCACHALPGLKSPKTGEPTGAIYGVLSMLRKLAADYKPDALACVFDARGKTFRDAEYSEYKANRTPMPDDLGVQVGPLHEAVRALGWPVLIIEGVEADDVIATLTERAKRAGWRTVISTGDKDLTQLVDERVLWVNTMSNEKLDAAGVEAKFGVPPDKIVDYLALVGDSIDGAEAQRIGLVSALVPEEEREAGYRRWLDRAVALASQGTRATKRAMRAMGDMDYDTALGAYLDYQRKGLASGDFAEAMLAYREQRMPNWS